MTAQRSSWKDAPFELLALSAFSILATVFGLAIMFVPTLRSLKETIVPITGWNPGFPYMFLIYFLCAMCSRRLPRGRVLTVRMMLPLLLLLGAAFGVGMYLFHRTRGHNLNPYLDYQPLQPLYTVALPAFCALLLFSPRITRWLKDTPDSEQSRA